jgi:PiT family inorganic phosphate transporter
MLLLAAFSIACVGFANGANDLSRATATLIGGRVTLYRKAMLWTVAWTFAGSLLSGILAKGVAFKFAHAIQANSMRSPALIFATAVGAFLWLAIGSRRGLPVSTTHALLGAIVGIAWLHGGLHACRNLRLSHGFLLPMLTSPLLALLLVLLVRRLALRFSFASLHILNRAHWVSSGFVAFSRGVNDSAKIWALILPFTAASARDLTPASNGMLVFVAFAMLLGGLLGGRQVAETVAHRITKMDLRESLAANLSTSIILMTASLLAFPVASSHVLGGAVLGNGLAKKKGLHRPLVAEMAIAWGITFPASAILAIGCERIVATHLAWILICLGSFGLYLAFLRPAPALLRRDARRLYVFVCAGNTSRSPMAMWICRAEFAKRLGVPLSLLSHYGISIVSAGLEGRVGQPMTAAAVAALSARGISPGPHQSSVLTYELALEADAIYCMTGEQQEDVVRKFPFAASKTLRLHPRLDIPNPAGQDERVYHQVAFLIHSSVGAQFAVTIFA